MMKSRRWSPTSVVWRSSRVCRRGLLDRQFEKAALVPLKSKTKARHYAPLQITTANSAVGFADAGHRRVLSGRAFFSYPAVIWSIRLVSRRCAGVDCVAATRIGGQAGV